MLGGSEGVDVSQVLEDLDCGNTVQSHCPPHAKRQTEVGGGRVKGPGRGDGHLPCLGDASMMIILNLEEDESQQHAHIVQCADRWSISTAEQGPPVHGRAGRYRTRTCS